MDGSERPAAKRGTSVADSDDDLVWCVDPVTFEVAWGNGPFRTALEEHGVVPVPRLPHGDLFTSEPIAEAWATLYEDALRVGRLSCRQEFLGSWSLDVTIVAIERNGRPVGLAVFGTEFVPRWLRNVVRGDTDGRMPASVSVWPTTTS
jgi:hypothetical protein